MLRTHNNFHPAVLERWLCLFIFLHILAWTLVPFYTRYNLPLDAMEGATWGQHLAWGYDKDPYLNAWLTALAVKLSGTAGWAVYLFSQLSVAICFWAVWELGKKIVSPLYALLAVLMLEGVQYYNFHAIDFNDNTLELSLWALTILFFYTALQQQTWRVWLLTGIYAGLGLMTKYYTVMLLLPMLIFLLLRPEGRASWRTPGIYLGIIAFCGIILPHVVWLFKHDFVTVHYVLSRLQTTPTDIPHGNYACIFAQQQFAAVMPLLGLLVLLVIGRRPWFTSERVAINSFDKQFLIVLGLGPFLLTVVLAAATGIKLRAGWGEPLLSLWSIMLLAGLQPFITPAKFLRFLLVFFSLLALTLVLYASALWRASAPSSANFPGAIIAKTLTQEWHAGVHTPLPYVAGPRWLAGNIAFYSNDHPTVYIDWNRRLSPWINETDVKKKGAIFVWGASNDREPTPTEIAARFAGLGQPAIRHFFWLRSQNSKPLEITVAFLPPQRV